MHTSSNNYFVIISQPVVLEPFDVNVNSNISDSESSESSSSSSSSSSLSSPTSEEVIFDDPFETLFNDSGINLEDNFNSSKLFPGSSLNVLGALAILISWFSSFPGISKQAFHQLLHILHHFILPSGNCLPATYSEAFSIIQSFLVPVKEYHCCPNDCILYRGAYADATTCAVCGEGRYLEGCTPKKRFKYLPLMPRIERYFCDASISKLIQSHTSPQSSPSADVHDIQQTDTWKEWYSQTGLFHGDARGLSLALCLDGTNPFSKEKNSYSMWPVVVLLLNLPPGVCHITGFLQLMEVIPGRWEPKNTDPYLQVFADELQSINGTRLYDAHQQSWFNLQIELLMHILDYPGQC